MSGSDRSLSLGAGGGTGAKVFSGGSLSLSRGLGAGGRLSLSARGGRGMKVLSGSASGSSGVEGGLIEK